MSEREENLPAFPIHPHSRDAPIFHGMSLRDWFAGQAAAGLCKTEEGFTWKVLAEDAYRMADAMLAARKAQL